MKENTELKIIIESLEVIKYELNCEIQSLVISEFTLNFINKFKEKNNKKIDLCICGLMYLNEDFKNRVPQISLIIDKLEEVINKNGTYGTYKYASQNMDGINNKIKSVIEELKRFNEKWNGSEKSVNNFEEYAEQSKLNVSEAINTPKVELKGKDLTDEAILNENIETMRKEIKELEGTTFEPLEKAKAITMLSEEIRECINMKNYIALSNRQYESEEATC